MSGKSEVEDISNEQHPRFIDLMYTMQEAYSGVGCEVLCDVLQIVGEGVAWQCRAWSTLIGCYKIFNLNGLA